MKQFQDLVRRILDEGDYEENRTGVNTYSVISADMEIDMSDGKFPLLTTKAMAFKAIIGELIWFLSGSSDINDLRQMTGLSSDDFCIWQKNLDEYNQRMIKRLSETDDMGVKLYPNDIMIQNSDLGHVYGKAWRFWGGDYDQIGQLVSDIFEVKNNPAASVKRRLIVNTWDPIQHRDDLACALPPCHYGFQCFVRNGQLSLKWIQRSVDTFLGLPFNIASYGALLLILCKITGLKPGKLIVSGGDVHIYEDHIDQCRAILGRKPMELCTLELPDIEGIHPGAFYRLTAKDFKIVNYQSHGALKGNMS